MIRIFLDASTTALKVIQNYTSCGSVWFKHLEDILVQNKGKAGADVEMNQIYSDKVVNTKVKRKRSLTKLHPSKSYNICIWTARP